jgi:hypothetical protein
MGRDGGRRQSPGWRPEGLELSRQVGRLRVGRGCRRETGALRQSKPDLGPHGEGRTALWACGGVGHDESKTAGGSRGNGIWILVAPHRRQHSGSTPVSRSSRARQSKTSAADG